MKVNAPESRARGTLRCSDFALATTLTSGQVFRWPREGSAFTGWINSSLLRITQEGKILVFEGAYPDAIRHFFSLDLNLKELADQFDADDIIHQAIKTSPGLRVIRQDPWECLASFILSSFNNIPRLTGMLNRLAIELGEPMEEMRATESAALRLLRHRFPRPEVVAKTSEYSLRHCGLGFRAPYLKAAAQRIDQGTIDLERLRNLEDEQLREKLLTIPGVGEKVVECVMLFGFQRSKAFPVDVWISRVMRRWYFRQRTVSDKRIREFACQHFGPYCGWAQQYLYCFARTEPSAFIS